MWALAILAGSVGLSVKGADDVDPADRAALVSGLEAAIAARTDRVVRVDDPVWGKSDCASACYEEIRARLVVEDVVLVRIVGGLSVDRIVVERLGPGAARITKDVPREAEARKAVLEVIAQTLFEPKKAVEVTAPPPPPAERGLPLVPLIFAGVSVAALGAGVGLGVSSRSARDASQDPTLTLDAFDPLADRAQQHGIAANVLFGTALSAALVAVVVWLIEEGE